MPKTRYFFKQIFYRDVTECLIKQEIIFYSETNHRSALFSPSKRAENRCKFSISGILSGRDKHWDIIITFTVVFRPRAFISYPYRLYLTKFLKMALLISAVGAHTDSYRLIPDNMLFVIQNHPTYQKMARVFLGIFFLLPKMSISRQKAVFLTGIGTFYRSENVTIGSGVKNYI